MTWVRLDDQWADHPKFLDVGDYGQLLWVKGLSYAARYLTDGFIPARAVSKMLHATRQLPSAIRELVTAGLWVEVEGGYQVHDYKDYQPLAAQVKAEREAARERVKRWRERHLNGDSNGVTNGARDALRAGARAGAGLGSGSGSGSASERGVQGGGDDATRIETEIRRHSVFDALDSRAIADAHAGRLMTSSQKVDWVLTAIDECAAKHTGLGLQAQALQGRLIGFMRNAKRPKESPKVSRVAPEGDDRELTDEEIDANLRAMKERNAKAEAERERRALLGQSLEGK